MDFIRFGLSQALASQGSDRFQLCLTWTCLLLGLWCLISTAEWISRRDLFEDQGLLSWRVLALREHRLYRSRILAPLFQRRGVTLALGLRLACAIGVMWPAQGWSRLALLAGIISTGWLLKLRKWLADDGSDQMGALVALGAAFTALGLQAQDLLLCFAGSLLIAGQLTICYLVAGAAKLISFEWRSGRAVVGIMGTEGFGDDLAARFVSSRTWLPIAVCWGAILMETSFPLIILGPPLVLLIVLGAFMLFHIATALFMGLNTHLGAFVAAYPSVVLVNDLIRGYASH